MKTVILKFGGAAVARPENFASVAQIVQEKKKHYARVVVVVSAMGSATDTLIQLAHQVNEKPPSRELAMLMSVGERVSGSLLAMALKKLKIDRLWTPSGHADPFAFAIDMVIAKRWL